MGKGDWENKQRERVDYGIEARERRKIVQRLLYQEN